MVKSAELFQKMGLNFKPLMSRYNSVISWMISENQHKVNKDQEGKHFN